MRLRAKRVRSSLTKTGLDLGKTAIQKQFRSRDVAAVVGSEKHHGLRDLIRVPSLPSGTLSVAIQTMLDFASRHNVAPQTEHFPMRDIDEAFARLDSGNALYRIVLDADV
jgi:hypothetical protein